MTFLDDCETFCEYAIAVLSVIRPLWPFCHLFRTSFEALSSQVEEFGNRDEIRQIFYDHFKKIMRVGTSSCRQSSPQILNLSLGFVLKIDCKMIVRSFFVQTADSVEWRIWWRKFQRNKKSQREIKKMKSF
jgi:hypothetical protein